MTSTLVAGTGPQSLGAERGSTTLPLSVALLTCPVEIRRDDENVLLRDWTPATSVAWGVWVCGYRMGGRHYEYGEALAHAFRVSKWSPKERAEWVATHRALGIREEAAKR